MRCLCLRYYIVVTERGDESARKRARDKAESMGAIYIDVRACPFMICSCGQQLDFIPEASLMIQ